MVLKENKTLSTLIYAIDKASLILEGPLSVNLDIRGITVHQPLKTAHRNTAIKHKGQQDQWHTVVGLRV